MHRDLILSVKNELNWCAESKAGGSVFDVELQCKTLSGVPEKIWIRTVDKQQKKIIWLSFL